MFFFVINSCVNINEYRDQKGLLSQEGTSLSTPICGYMLSNRYSSADLFELFKDCINKEIYDESVLIYLLAKTYGLFDCMRVSNKQLHNVLFALQMETIGSLSELKYEHINIHYQRIRNDPHRYSVLCSKIKKIGPPNYYPHYMIQFTRPSVSKGPKELLRKVDTGKVWSRLLQKLDCM